MTIRMVAREEWSAAACDQKDCPTAAYVRSVLHVGHARANRKWTNGKGTLCDACAEEAGWIFEPLDENGKPSNRYEVRS